MTTSLKTTRKIVLDFDQAIKQGMCRDQNGDKQLIRGHGDQFLITACDGQEYCFDRKGIQVGAPSKKLKLVDPAKVEVKLLPYLIYDDRTMTILDQADGAMDGLARKEIHAGEHVRCINVTHPANQKVLQQLGITRRSWYENA